MAYLAGISIFPIKSLDGISPQEIAVLESGALENDRRWAFMDSQGRFVNGKRNAKVHLLRTEFSPDLQTVRLRVQGTDSIHTFDLTQQQRELEAWLSDFFGLAVHLQDDRHTGFPDDTHAPGPTVISSATLSEVATWFPGLETADLRRRLRTNLEIAEVPPFWEDQLFGAETEGIRFQIGEVILGGVNPCQRCIVPVRDSLTGEPYPHFQKTLMQRRQQTLPPWTNPQRFNHFYRLAVNTRIPASEAGKLLRVGDPVQLLKPASV